MFKFSKRSLNNLKGVNPNLVSIAHKALEISTIDFVVIEGLRTVERQRQLVKAGASWTMNSKHITGRAIDVVPWHDGAIRWDWPLFIPIAQAFQSAAEELQIDVTWGGTWKRLNGFGEISMKSLHRSKADGPHFELS